MIVPIYHPRSWFTFHQRSLSLASDIRNLFEFMLNINAKSGLPITLDLFQGCLMWWEGRERGSLSLDSIFRYVNIHASDDFFLEEFPLERKKTGILNVHLRIWIIVCFFFSKKRISKVVKKNYIKLNKTNLVICRK